MDKKQELVKNVAEGLKALTKALEVSPQTAKSLNEKFEVLTKGENPKEAPKASDIKSTDSQHNIEENKEVPPSMAEKAKEMKKEEMGKAGEGMMTLAGGGSDTASPTMGAGSTLAMAEEKPEDKKDDEKTDWEKEAKRWKKKAKKWKKRAKGKKEESEEPNKEMEKSQYGLAKAEYIASLSKKHPEGVNPEKYERCVKEVKAKQGEEKVNPWAICTSSMKKSSFQEHKAKFLKLRGIEMPEESEGKPGLPEELMHLHPSKLKADHMERMRAGLTKEENPDLKEDAELGEDVEHLVEDHMMENKDAEREEGHEMMKAEALTTGVHKPGLHHPGRSAAGETARWAKATKRPELYEAAKGIHKETLKDLKAQPKPDLPKSEMNKDEKDGQEAQEKRLKEAHKQQEKTKKEMKKEEPGARLGPAKAPAQKKTEEEYHTDVHPNPKKAIEDKDLSSSGIPGAASKPVKDEMGNGQSEEAREKDVLREKRAMNLPKSEMQKTTPAPAVPPPPPKPIPPKGSQIPLKGKIKPESINKLKDAGYHPYFKSRMDKMQKGDVVDIKSKKVISSDGEEPLMPKRSQAKLTVHEGSNKRSESHGRRGGDRPPTNKGGSGGMGGRRSTDDPRYKKPLPAKRKMAFGERHQVAGKIERGHTKRGYEQRQTKSKAAKEAHKEFYGSKHDEKVSGE